MRCSSISNLTCRVSTVTVNLVMRAARSAVVGSAIDEEMDEVGDDGAAGVGRWGGSVVVEDRLDRDTRLSRAPASRVPGPRLWSS